MQSISIILGKYQLQITPTSSLGPAQSMPTFNLLLLTIFALNILYLRDSERELLRRQRTYTCKGLTYLFRKLPAINASACLFVSRSISRNVTEHIATRRNAPQRTATHRSMPQRTATRRNAPYRPATLRNA